MLNDSTPQEFKVTETFFSIEVADMDRASHFYATALGATVTWASPQWSSLQIAGVRLGLFMNPKHTGGRVGLHFAVTDLDGARAAVEHAGGKVITPIIQVAPQLFIEEVSDTEGNIFALRKDQVGEE